MWWLCVNQAQDAKAKGDDKGRIAAENKICGIVGGLNAVFEQYPDLCQPECFAVTRRDC